MSMAKEVCRALALLHDSSDVLGACKKMREENKVYNSMIAGVELACINYYDLWESLSLPAVSSCATSISIPIIDKDSFAKFEKNFNGVMKI